MTKTLLLLVLTIFTISDGKVLFKNPQDLKDIHGNRFDIPSKPFTLSFIDWNGDNLLDLFLCESYFYNSDGTTSAGRIRFYKNIGTNTNPQFDSSFTYLKVDEEVITNRNS